MERSTEVTERSAFPLGKVARCCAYWRCIVTDEVRPPSVGVTAAAAASAPSSEGGKGAPAPSTDKILRFILSTLLFNFEHRVNAVRYSAFCIPNSELLKTLHQWALSA